MERTYIGPDWDTRDIVLAFQEQRRYDGMRLYIHLSDWKVPRTPMEDGVRTAHLPTLEPLFSHLYGEEKEDEYKILSDPQTMDIIASKDLGTDSPFLVVTGNHILFAICDRQYDAAINLAKYRKLNPVHLYHGPRYLYTALRDSGHIQSVSYDSMIIKTYNPMEQMFYMKECICRGSIMVNPLVLFHTMLLVLMVVAPLLCHTRTQTVIAEAICIFPYICPHILFPYCGHIERICKTVTRWLGY